MGAAAVVESTHSLTPIFGPVLSLRDLSPPLHLSATSEVGRSVGPLSHSISLLHLFDTSLFFPSLSLPFFAFYPSVSELSCLPLSSYWSVSRRGHASESATVMLQQLHNF